MDTPNFSGLGTKLQRVLQALDIDNLEPPVWSLKENKGKIYLDICWVKFPAVGTEVIQPTRTTSKTQSARPPLNNNLEQGGLDAKPPPHAKVNEETPAVDRPTHVSPSELRKKRKKKSPSTQKRDKLRLVKWLAKKKQSSEIASNTSEQASHIANGPNISSAAVKSNQQQESPVTVKVTPAPELGNQAEKLDVPEHNPAAGKTPTPVKHWPSIPTAYITDSDDSDSETDGESEVDLTICSNSDCAIPAYLAPGGLKKCARCHRAQYCGRKCQTEDWKLHKTFCIKL